MRIIAAVVPFDLATLNHLRAAEFVRLLGPVFEHSPWIAERAEKLRPFADGHELHRAMCSVVAEATTDEQLTLIRAHPDLVGKAMLTAESSNEQASAGLTNLTSEEIEQFDHYNKAYREKFSFPFVICARLNRKAAILEAFPIRLQNEPEAERVTALAEIYKIAELRLADLLAT